MNNSKKTNVVFNKYSVVVLVLVFTIWTFGELAYRLGRHLSDC